MKPLPIVIFSLLFCPALGWSQNNDVVTFNTAKNTSEELTNSMMKYPQFSKGKAVLRTGSELQGLLNYNYGTNEILFISSKNDTLSVAHPEQYSHVVIGTDTFAYAKDAFVQLLKSTAFCKLYVKRSLTLVGKEKKAAYGGYSSTSSSTPINNYNDGAIAHTIPTDENLLYKLKNTFYLSDRFNNMYPASKKNVRELGWKNDKLIKEYLENNRISFDKREDLEKLVDFLNSVPQEQ